jgi:hypothetical protein
MAPSSASKIPARTMSHAAAIQFSCVAFTMAKKPQKRFIDVKELGITERVTRIGTAYVPWVVCVKS